MRSHAKALSAGSNAGRGKSLGLFVVLVVAIASCIGPGSAFAAETRFPTESFGPGGTAETSFEFATALAFDQGSGSLYALDQAPAEIYGFDSSTVGTHVPLTGNFPLAVENSFPGFLDDLAVNSTSHDIYALTEANRTLRAFDSGGTPLAGNFPVTGFGDSCGAAVDPSGHIWVGDYETETIHEFDSTGNPLGSVSTGAQGHPCRVAVDSAGNLYVGLYEGATWRYSAASGYSDATEVDPTPSVALTVDRSSDDVYVLHSNHVSVYGDSGTPLYEFGENVVGAEFKGIAVDETHDEIYVSDLSNHAIRVFGPPVFPPDITTEDADPVVAAAATLRGMVNPDGEQLTDCHFDIVPASQFEVDRYQSLTPAEQAPCVPAAASIPADTSPHAVSADFSGLAPGTTYYFRLVAANAEGAANGADRTLTTATGAPAVSTQSVAAVGITDVTVSARINPRGSETTYHVEYGPTASYGQSSAESAPLGFSGDNSDHSVSVHIGGLSAGTAYHFRFVATSLAGAAEGTDSTFATYPATSGPRPCPNDQFRTGFGIRLPDCRAYEQATPTDKHGANVQGSLDLIQAGSGGNRIIFFLNGGLPSTGGASSLSPFLASRGAGSWSSDGLLPPTNAAEANASFTTGWSGDLATTLSTAVGPGGIGAAIYMRNADTGVFQPSATGSNALREAYLADFAADTSHFTFETFAGLVPGAPGGVRNLYDYDNDAVTLASRIPAGSATSCDDEDGPACVIAPSGSFAGPYRWENQDTAHGGASGGYYTQNTLSRDGSRVFFTAAGSGQLYVREDGTRSTRISASQRTTPDPNGERPAAFLAATPDGSKVFFASCEKLTDDSTASSNGEKSCTTPAQGQDLYEYDVDSGELKDLTVDSNVGDLQGAAVQGIVGTSEDGSYVYYVANGVLASGASSGGCRIGFFDFGFSQTCSLYLSHDGDTTFIASLKSEDRNVWIGSTNSSSGEAKTSRVAADGSAVLFGSRKPLTGYNDDNSVCGEGHCEEFFRYSASNEALTCVSCNPTGVPPVGPAALTTGRTFAFRGPHSTFVTRNISADGRRAFFDTPDPLLPADTNGVLDVYEWEAKDSGSCESESQGGGCLYLLSSGTSPDPSYFGDASSDGSHAFVFTDQQLVPADHDQLYDIYDAGVGDGLASQHILAPPTCTSTACQVNPAPPPEPTAASAVFSGPGNARRHSVARRCPKGKRKVRRAGKVRCERQAKQHKRHSNRGGAK